MNARISSSLLITAAVLLVQDVAPAIEPTRWTAFAVDVSQKT